MRILFSRSCKFSVFDGWYLFTIVHCHGASSASRVRAVFINKKRNSQLSQVFLVLELVLLSSSRNCFMRAAQFDQLSHTYLPGQCFRLLGDIGLYQVIRLLIWLWCFLLVFSVKESILMCLFHARKTNWEIAWKFFNLAATNSASLVRVVSPEECNLFESSMLSSPSKRVKFQCYSVPASWHRRSLYGDSELVRNQGAIIERRSFPRCVVTEATKNSSNSACFGREWTIIYVSWSYVGNIARVLERAPTAP